MKSAIIIGAGPAGLIAAERLAQAGVAVALYEKKPSPGRKFLMAGRGGLNLTHSEDLEHFLDRYGAARGFLEPAIRDFTPQDLVAWCEGLGEETFTGSSGRIFPRSFKASPLLRAWIKRLEASGVVFHMQSSWRGWTGNNDLLFTSADGAEFTARADVTLLALGGASWPGLGSDGIWAQILAAHAVELSPFQPANCGFHVSWSPLFADKFAGRPLKSVALSFEGRSVKGEIMVNRSGVEGGAIYALSSALRESLHRNGTTRFTIDLKPSMDRALVLEKLETQRKGRSFSTFLEKTLNLAPLPVHLLRECDLKVADYPPGRLADLIKAVPVEVTAPFGIAKAISTAGGIKREELDGDFMLKKLPSVFAAGEMLDWEAPTGGYLLQASFATGAAAAKGMVRYLKDHASPGGA